MSLTSLLKYSADVRERFKAEFPIPPLGSQKELLAPPLTQNYSWVGTAFDYLLRIHIEHLNPKAETGKWIAEKAVLGNDDDFQFSPPKFRRLLKQAKDDHARYQASGMVDDKLLRSVLCLAQMEVFYRRGVDDSYYEKVGKIDRKDVQDLRNLISLVQPMVFGAKSACILNPTFGRASELVGGADCDLILDDALVEIKTTKDFKVKREYFDQLIGYYLLFRIGGVNGLPKSCSIKKLGIYFSRHGHLWLFDVNTVINEKKLPGFLRWFKKRARQGL